MDTTNPASPTRRRCPTTPASWDATLLTPASLKAKCNMQAPRTSATRSKRAPSNAVNPNDG
eukprot:10633558-Alexandrium_andersonii.AAC.1